jgi:hypothetical protein
LAIKLNTFFPKFEFTLDHGFQSQKFLTATAPAVEALATFLQHNNGTLE